MLDLNIIFSRIMGIEAIRRQSIVSLIWNIAFTFIGFFSTIYFARAVGASVLGAYFLFTAYYGIINMVNDGGFGGAAIKRISEGEDQDAYFSAFFLLRSLFVTLVIIAFIMLRSYFVDLDNAGAFDWLLAALAVSILYGTIGPGVAGCGKMGIHTTCEFINKISRILIQVIAVFFGFNVAGLFGGFIAGMLIGATIELRFFNLNFVRFGWRHIKSLSSFSFWLFLTSSGILVFSNVDTIMIGYYLSTEDIGVYRVVFQFAGISAFTTSALRGTLWPRVSRWGKVGDFGLIESSLSKALTYSLILAVPVLAGGILLGDKLLYIYGTQFVRGYTVLMILLFAQTVEIFRIFFTTYLSALNRVKDSFKATITAVSANILFNFMLIPLIGIEGAAIATLVAITLNALLAQRLLSRMITIKLEHNSLLNIFKASGLMSIFVMLYRIMIPLSNIWLTLIPVVFGGFVYGILILKFDTKICDDLKGIATQMNLPWPSWF